LSRLLLDTTFLVDADRSKESLDDLIADDDEMAIAAITIAELLVGALLADTAHRADRQHFVNEVRESIQSSHTTPPSRLLTPSCWWPYAAEGGPEEPTT
jgi:tRNA(fMet)-specific endonuclease VapC